MLKTLSESDQEKVERYSKTREGQCLLLYGFEAQLLGMYLHHNRFFDLCGYYDLPLKAITEETGLDFKTLQGLFPTLSSLGIAEYDWETERVHVPLCTRIYTKIMIQSLEENLVTRETALHSLLAIRRCCCNKKQRKG